MALTWEKWRELFKDKWADVFDWVWPFEKGGTNANSVDGARKNITSLEEITHTQLNDYQFWLGKNGVTVAYCPEDLESEQPYTYGLIVSVNAKMDVQQIFMGTDNSTYRRWANHNGWHGVDKTAGSGKKYWAPIGNDFMQRGLAWDLSIAANGSLDHKVIFPKAFNEAPALTVTPVWNADYLAEWRVLELTSTYFTIRLKSRYAGGPLIVNVSWVAIGKQKLE